MLILWIVLGLAAALYLALRLVPLYIRWVDRAPDNDRTLLPYQCELPSYFRLDRYGNVDTSARWPGWDAWTVSAIPDDPALPPLMIRGTLMTGLYGLEGIDNYENLIYRLGTYQAVEHLCMVPTAYRTANGQTMVLDNLSQHYLPKDMDLQMADASLDVTILGSRVDNEVTSVPYAQLRGTWPDYSVSLLNPESEISIDLVFHGRRIAWWTDIPGRYSHFSAFGTFAIAMEYRRGTKVRDPHRPLPEPETFRFEARGALDHVSAAKPFGFDRLWLPLRLISRWIPALKHILYHYEVLIGDGVEGGFVHARAFGIDFRNRGGLFAGDGYHEITNVQVRYLVSEALDDCSGRNSPTEVWRRWTVEAATPAGPLAYAATRTHPPAMVSSRYNQYHFTFEGTWLGRRVTGSGYGEYVYL